MTDPVVEELDGSSGLGVAAEILEVVHAAFGARPPLDPPGTALEETVDTVAAALADGGGLVARVGGQVVGTLLMESEEGSLHLRRVSVLPRMQGRGYARRLQAAAERIAAARGHHRVQVVARAELPATVGFWRRAGYAEIDRQGTSLVLAKALPLSLDVPTADDMRELGRRLARLARSGDLLLLTGDLGAGKTTLTQGLGDGLGVRGGVTSPTFVISRVHPSLVGGPALVHVDAYRLGGLAELDDLDLEVSLEESVTVVEWGEGIAEALAEDRLDIRVSRSHGRDAEGGAEGGSVGGGGGLPETRRVRIAPVGARWAAAGLTGLV